MWNPTSATLISGARDAVLVDAFLTVNQAGDLADWVAAYGMHRAFALAAVIERMRQNATPERRAIARRRPGRILLTRAPFVYPAEITFGAGQHSGRAPLDFTGSQATPRMLKG